MKVTVVLIACVLVGGVAGCGDEDTWTDATEREFLDKCVTLHLDTGDFDSATALARCEADMDFYQTFRCRPSFGMAYTERFLMWELEPDPVRQDTMGRELDEDLQRNCDFADASPGGD